MSFHWNLSSEDEFDDLPESQIEERSYGEFPEFAFGDATVVEGDADAIPATAKPIAHSNSCSDEDDVDWEDADDQTDEDDGKLRPLTIDMDSKSSSVEQINTKKRQRRRNAYKYDSLTPAMQSLLRNLHRSHLLCLLCRSVLISRCCSDQMLLLLALSLVPPHLLTKLEIGDNERKVPNSTQVRDFCTWFFDFVHHVEQRRLQKLATNVAAGAPRAKRQKGNSYFSKSTKQTLYGHGTTSTEHLMDVCAYLSSANDENPQLLADETCMTSHDIVQLMVTIARAIGWRARHVAAFDPIKCDLDMNHPLLISGLGNVFAAVQSIHEQDRKKPAKQKAKAKQRDGEDTQILDNHDTMVWAEFLWQPNKAETSAAKYQWVHVCPVNQLIDRPRMAEALFYVRKFDGIVRPKKSRTVSFALAVEHLPAETMVGGTYNIARLTDVTRRYANSWSKSLRGREPRTNNGTQSWWYDTIAIINSDARYQATWVCGDVFGTHMASGMSKAEAINVAESSDNDSYGGDVEEDELEESAGRETMPTSKAGFKNHPIYIIESQLGVAQVLAPDAKSRFCGIFKGELVYRRGEVSTAMVAKRWLYEGRIVKDEEMGRPVKRVKARKKQTKTGFQPLASYGVGSTNDGSDVARQKDIDKVESEGKEDDGMKDLYAIWQTKPWSPDPVGPDDDIPLNEYRNVERALINPGLVHLEAPRMSVVAKNLGIPYAPCLLGFEGHGGNRTPVIRGIVVHEHNAELLTEAYAEVESQVVEQEHDVRQATILRRWKKLITGILIKARVDREYGDVSS